jgi:heme/copper-type cytochrome/quinol oxidase subunit 2
MQLRSEHKYGELSTYIWLLFLFFTFISFSCKAKYSLYLFICWYYGGSKNKLSDPLSHQEHENKFIEWEIIIPCIWVIVSSYWGVVHDTSIVQLYISLHILKALRLVKYTAAILITQCSSYLYVEYLGTIFIDGP